MPKDFRVLDTSRNAYAETLAAQPDAGAGVGLLVIYQGAVPTNPEDAAGFGTDDLVKIPLNDPAFTAPAVAGAIELDVSGLVANANRDGTATFFRFYESADGTTVVDPANCKHQGLVGVTGGTFDLELSKVDIVNGDEVTITAGTLTVERSLTP